MSRVAAAANADAVYIYGYNGSNQVLHQRFIQKTVELCASAKTDKAQNVAHKTYRKVRKFPVRDSNIPLRFKPRGPKTLKVS